MSSAPQVPDSVLDQIITHVRSELSREVGGMLVGTIGDGKAVVTAAIPALRAESGSANVTFTQDVWEDILTSIDRDHPNEQIVGWYHSHPGFGVFLSDYDTFIHSNFFSDPAMLALVVDPLSGDAGWFAGGNTPKRFASFTVAAARHPLDSNPVLTGPSGNTWNSTWLLGGIAAVVVAFAVGWTLSPDRSQMDAAGTQGNVSNATEVDSVADLAAELERAQMYAETLEGDLADAEIRLTEALALGDVTKESGGQLVYVVAPGDSLWSISSRFYGRGGHWPAISDANNLITDVIEVGTELRLPGLVSSEPGDVRWVPLHGSGATTQAGTDN